MKIVVAGGKAKADFLIESLLKKKHQLIVINDDQTYCNYLSDVHGIPIVCGDPCKPYILSDAAIQDYDILIALKPSDTDNLAICQLAKRLYNIKKTVCTVANPKNVDLFKQLGVSTVISATYMVANVIEQASTIENLIKSLSLEDEKIIIMELLVAEDYPVCNKKLMDIDFPPNVIISCIIRHEESVVPNGQTVIYPGDKLVIISSPQNQEAAIKKISGKAGKKR